MGVSLFQKYPECIENRIKLKGILTDLYPEKKMQINLILMAFDEGIVDTINKEDELSQLVFTRCKKSLMENYGLASSKAEWAVNFWFSQYGAKTCGKKYDKPIKDDVKKDSPPAEPIKVQGITDYDTSSRTTPSRSSMQIDIKAMKEDEKLPKEIIEIVGCNDSNVNIQSLTCSLRKGYVHNNIANLKITGEYNGSSSKYVLIMMMVYNANNELVGFNSNVKINNKFNGTNTFSEDIRIPEDEFVSKVVVRLALDATFV